MDNTNISQDMFKKVNVDSQSREHIARPQLTAFQDGWIRFRKNKAAMAGLIVLFIILLLALLGPVFSPRAYYDTDYTRVFNSPGADAWFGTDQFGRDQWVRIWQGTRISLLIAVCAAFLDLFVGVTYGAISALLGGKVDTIMQRIIEILNGIPSLVVVILLMMVMPAGVLTIVVAMSFTGWVNMARLVRAQILKLKNQEFILAAQVLSTSKKDIILKHLLPNTVGVIVINTMFTIPSAIFTEAFLSFIGIGLQEPNASLGVLINNGYSVLQNFPHLLFFPAAVIVLLMVCFSMVGDGLRDALDPRMRK